LLISILKRHIKIIIILIILALLVLFVIHVYMSFIQPLVQPYFFKARNIERLSGLRLPANARIIEYNIDADPTATLGRVRGIRGIEAKIAIDQETYEYWREHKFNHFNDKERYLEILRVRQAQGGWGLIDINYVKEISFFPYRASLYYVDYHNLFSRSIYAIMTATNIDIVITREEGGFYLLYLFFTP